MQNTPDSFNNMENNQPEYNCPLNIITKWDEVRWGYFTAIAN